jgi:DNA helicase TIP49 (TBP-interacting protein)
MLFFLTINILDSLLLISSNSYFDRDIKTIKKHNIKNDTLKEINDFFFDFFAASLSLGAHMT